MDFSSLRQGAEGVQSSQASLPSLSFVVGVLITLVGSVVIFKWCMIRRRRTERERRLVHHRTIWRNSHDSGSDGIETPSPPITIPRVAIVRPEDAHDPGKLAEYANASVVLHALEAPVDVAEDACAICLDPLKDDPVSHGPCNHYLHTTCLHAWLSKDPSQVCPICKTPFASQSREKHVASCVT